PAANPRRLVPVPAPVDPADHPFDRVHPHPPARQRRPRTPRGAPPRQRWGPAGIRSLGGRTARAVAVTYGAAMGRGQSSAPPQHQYDEHDDNDDDYGAYPDI